MTPKFEVTVENEDGDITYACNEEGRGLFRWNEAKSEYRQIVGTTDTGRFADAAALKAFAKARLSTDS